MMTLINQRWTPSEKLQVEEEEAGEGEGEGAGAGTILLQSELLHWSLVRSRSMSRGRLSENRCLGMKIVSRKHERKMEIFPFIFVSWLCTGINACVDSTRSS